MHACTHARAYYKYCVCVYARACVRVRVVCSAREVCVRTAIIGDYSVSVTRCATVPQFQLQDVPLCLSFSYKMCHCASVSVTRCVIVPQFQLQDVPLCLSFSYKKTDFISSCIKAYPTAHYWGQKRDQTVTQLASLCHGFTYNKHSNTACIIVPWFHLQQTVFMHTNLPNHSLLELVSY